MKMIKLYHFTGSDHAAVIKSEGITKGGVMLPNGRVVWGYIWLTDDPRFSAQHWATNHSGACGDRLEVRFTLSVPIHSVVRWNEAAKQFQYSKSALIEFNLAGGSDGSHWYLSPYKIPVETITAIDYRS